VAALSVEADKISTSLAKTKSNLSPKGQKILADAAKAEKERLVSVEKQNARFATLPEAYAKRSRGANYSSGGMVKPKYFAVGGAARGTDIIPAMLTPGEFVMSKYAVSNYGVDKMKAINSGSYEGEKVYNYNLSVNVKSDANPDDIARVVMTQIKQIDSQRIRTQRS
jgi:hypothetical protein